MVGSRMAPRLLSALLVMMSLAVGCSGAAVPAPATRGAALAAPTPPDDEWARASWEDRHDTMTWTVLPSMARRFQAFRGEESPSLSCRSCHGADAEAVRYAMPNGLPPLDPKHMPRRDAADARTARVVAFMEDDVTPAMASMLGLPVASRAELDGAGEAPRGRFSCFSCHAVAR